VLDAALDVAFGDVPRAGPFGSAPELCGARMVKGDLDQALR
jgi:hypothetical protein